MVPTRKGTLWYYKWAQNFFLILYLNKNKNNFFYIHIIYITKLTPNPHDAYVSKQILISRQDMTVQGVILLNRFGIDILIPNP